MPASLLALSAVGVALLGVALLIVADAMSQASDTRAVPVAVLRGAASGAAIIAIGLAGLLCLS